jgi:cell division protein FtsQ
VEGNIREPPIRERAAPLAPAPTRGRFALARPWPSGRSVAVGVVLLAAAALAYVVARETPLFAVRTAVVYGAPPAAARDVRSALDRDVGSSLVTLDGTDVVGRLEALPTVISARYDRDFPHTLRIFVRPEQPVAVLRRGADSWLVSARGRIMQHVDRGTLRRLPRIWLDRGTAVELGGLLDGEPARLTAALAGLARSAFAGRVTTARSDESRVTFVLRSGLELRLGRPIDLALKLFVAREVLASVQPAAPGSYLDLAVPARPVGQFNSQLEG